jgi:hypothetical protein
MTSGELRRLLWRRSSLRIARPAASPQKEGDVLPQPRQARLKKLIFFLQEQRDCCQADFLMGLSFYGR